MISSSSRRSEEALSRLIPWMFGNQPTCSSWQSSESLSLFEEGSWSREEGEGGCGKRSGVNSRFREETTSMSGSGSDELAAVGGSRGSGMGKGERVGHAERSSEVNCSRASAVSRPVRLCRTSSMRASDKHNGRVLGGSFSNS